MLTKTAVVIAVAMLVAVTACGSSSDVTTDNTEPPDTTAAPLPDEDSDPDEPSVTEPADPDAPETPDDGSDPVTEGPDPDSAASEPSDPDDTSGSPDDTVSVTPDDIVDPADGPVDEPMDPDDTEGSPDDTVGSPDDAVAVTPGDLDDPADDADPDSSWSSGPEPGADRERQHAYVDSVDFQVMESWPMQVNVVVSASLPSPCWERWWGVTADGNTYNVEVLAVLISDDMVCAAVLVPFTDTIPLGDGFVAEDYTIIVNGATHSLSF